MFALTSKYNSIIQKQFRLITVTDRILCCDIHDFVINTDYPLDDYSS